MEESFFRLETVLENHLSDVSALCAVHFIYDLKCLFKLAQKLVPKTC